jgi:glycine/D-amino acid oxidase-like deaminating enzyme
MTRSKLQMLKARSKSGLQIGTHLCAGLTLGHYANFRPCKTLEPLLERYEREMPEYGQHGIHLLVSQHEDGVLTIGDSHHYGLDVTPFREEVIDQLIMAYLDTFLPIDDLVITERWYGVYAKHPTLSFVTDTPAEGVRLVTGVGGAGMTLSFGLAEHILREDGVVA